MAETTVIATFCIFLVLFLGIGALAARRAEASDQDYLLGSRSFGSFFVGLSAGATGNSGFIMVGMVGMAYTMGISALLLPISVFLGEWTFWTFFAEKVNRFSVETGTETVPEMLGAACKDTKGRHIVTSTVALITLILVGAYAVAQFAAAGKALNVFFGVSSDVGAILAAVAILSYCVTGGIRASIWTDVVQAFIVMAVSYGMLAMALVGTGGLFEAFVKLGTENPELINLTAGMTPWLIAAYVFGFAVLGVGFDLSQPPVLVRILAGRSPKEVRKAKWVYLGYVYSTWICMTLFGVLCRVLIPEIADPEQALPVFASEALHPIFVGITLAGMFSVIASTADSQILACSSALARDLSSKAYRHFHDRFGVRYQQASTLLFGIVALIATLTVSSSVFTLVLFAIGALAGALVPPMIVAVFKLRTHPVALSMSMLCGAGVAVGWRFVGWNSTFNESGPGMLSGLLVHAILMLLVFHKEERKIIPLPAIEAIETDRQAA